MEKTKNNRVRLTNDTLNSYGSRIITAGVDIDQYERNPVLLYMHRRGEVIGRLENIEKTDGEITAEVVFDLCSDRSKQCAAQWDAGSLRMVSVGIDIIELSEDASLLVPGQTRPAITRSKLVEVSIVDIGANDDAIRLTREGKMITFAEGGDNPLPLLSNIKTQKTMELNEKLIPLLGLAAGATEQEIVDAVRQNVSAMAGLEERLTAALVERAITDGKIEEDSREKFVEMGAKIGHDALQTVIDALPCDGARLSKVIERGGMAECYKKLSDVPAERLEAMRVKDFTQYARLYKAEYGMDCPVTGD